MSLHVFHRNKKKIREAHESALFSQSLIATFSRVDWLEKRMLSFLVSL